MKVLILIIALTALCHGLFSAITGESWPKMPQSIQFVIGLWMLAGVYVVVSLSIATAMSMWIDSK